MIMRLGEVFMLIYGMIKYTLIYWHTVVHYIVHILSRYETYDHVL